MRRCATRYTRLGITTFLGQPITLFLIACALRDGASSASAPARGSLTLRGGPFYFPINQIGRWATKTWKSRSTTIVYGLRVEAFLKAIFQVYRSVQQDTLKPLQFLIARHLSFDCVQSSITLARDQKTTTELLPKADRLKPSVTLVMIATIVAAWLPLNPRVATYMQSCNPQCLPQMLPSSKPRLY